MELPKLTKEVARKIDEEYKKEEERISMELKANGFEELDKVISHLKGMDKVSISYIQRTFSYGFIKSSKIFNYLVDTQYVDKNGQIIKENVYQHFNDTYESCYKVIFLDVDGVLNYQSTKDRCGDYIGIDDSKVQLLKEIVDKTKAKLVLVSTWKEYWFKHEKMKSEQDELANYLDKKLAKQGLEIWDKTDDYYFFNRGEGIIQYINIMNSKGNHITDFAIIDDEMFDYKETKLTRNLIQTSFYKGGLQAKHVGKALNQLGGE